MRLRLAPIHLILRGVTILIVGLLAWCNVPTYGSMRAIKKDAKRQIEDMESQWRDAQLTGNVAEMEKILSDDYFGISMTGQVNTKSQQLDRIRRRAMVLAKIDLSDVKLKLIGSTAIVTCRAEIEGVSDGVPVRGSFRYTRVYQRATAGQWKITNFEATRMARTTPTNQPTGDRESDPGRP